MQLFINSARFGRVFTACLCLVALGFAPMRTLAQIAQKTFNFTGAVQTFTIPAGVSSLTVVANGAEAGGGKGGRVTAVLGVQPRYDWVLSIYVGGQYGYNGGGTGAHSGGGATDIRINGTALADRVVVAGGGGGAGTLSQFTGDGRGGAGGNTTGADGTDEGSASGGLGGGASAGGAGGAGPNGDGGKGAAGIGGNGHGPRSTAGGGGGGYYGGGGGGEYFLSATQSRGGGGGGGGSSYTNTPFLVFGINVVHVQDVQTGNGSLTLSWQVNPLGAPTSLRRVIGYPYTSTNVHLQWTVNSTAEDHFLLERGKRTSTTQVYTDNNIVWTAVSPNPRTNNHHDNPETGLTANEFSYFYRVKAVSNRLGSSAYAYLIPD